MTPERALGILLFLVIIIVVLFVGLELVDRLDNDPNIISGPWIGG